MSRSPFLCSVSLLAACLLTVSGCSIGRPLLAGPSSATSSHAHKTTAADRDDEEPTDEPDLTKPLDQMEYGNCTASEYASTTTN